MNDNSSHQQIATLYRFCAMSMRYPDTDWLTDEYFTGLYTFLKALGAQDEIETIKGRLSSSADPLEELQIEYTRLFINGIPHVIAPPYGSVYCDSSLQGSHAEKTVKFYAAHGFSLNQEADLPDHIIHQLEFLSLLADNNQAEAEEEFLKTLFMPWFNQFYQRVVEQTTHPYYAVIMQLIYYLTKEDNEDGIQSDEA